MWRASRGAVGDLVAARGAAGGEHVSGAAARIFGNTPSSPIFSDFVMLGLEAERPAMPQQVEIEGFDPVRDQLQGFDRGGGRAERLLVAMAVQQRGFPRHRRERQFEAAGAALAGDEFLEELGARGERRGFRARQYRREFVAQR